MNQKSEPIPSIAEAFNINTAASKRYHAVVLTTEKSKLVVI
jgi:hypothetical protein